MTTVKGLRALIIIGVCVVVALVIAQTGKATDVFGDRVTMWLIHNFYKEECYSHEWETIQVEKKVCVGTFCNATFPAQCGCTAYEWQTVEELNITERCLKYHLVRKV